METRVYGTSYTSLSLCLRIANERRMVRFRGGGRNGNAVNYGVYVTSDKSIQEAIESLPNFGKRGKAQIFLKDVYFTNEGENPTEDVEGVEVTKEYLGVKTVQEMIAVLTEEYGMSISSVNTKAKAKAKAKLLGLSFPEVE